MYVVHSSEPPSEAHQATACRCLSVLCVGVCTCVRAHVRGCTHKHTYAYTRTSRSERGYIYIYICIHIYVCIREEVNIYTRTSRSGRGWIYIYICIHIYVCIREEVNIYTYTFLIPTRILEFKLISRGVFECVHAFERRWTYIWEKSGKYIYACKCVRVCVRLRVFVCVCVRRNIYIYMCIYIHIYTYVSFQFCFRGIHLVCTKKSWGKHCEILQGPCLSFPLSLSLTHTCTRICRIHFKYQHSLNSSRIKHTHTETHNSLATLLRAST